MCPEAFLSIVAFAVPKGQCDEPSPSPSYGKRSPQRLRLKMDTTEEYEKRPITRERREQKTPT